MGLASDVQGSQGVGDWSGGGFGKKDCLAWCLCVGPSSKSKQLPPGCTEKPSGDPLTLGDRFVGCQCDQEKTQINVSEPGGIVVPLGWVRGPKICRGTFMEGGGTKRLRKPPSGHPYWAKSLGCMEKQNLVSEHLRGGIRFAARGGPMSRQLKIDSNNRAQAPTALQEQNP